MNSTTNLTLSASPSTQSARNPRRFASLSLRRRSLYGRKLRRRTGKELDNETGLYYYGARYLDPKTSRWLSGDPAMGEYVPSAPVNEEAKKRNGSLPGMGGVFNCANLHVYHYAGNNPVKYTDPDGREDSDEYDAAKKAEGLKTEPIYGEQKLPSDFTNKLVKDDNWTDITKDEKARNEAAKDIKEKLDPKNEKYWHVSVAPADETYVLPTRPRKASEGGNLNDEGGKPLQGISEQKKYHGTIYRIYAKPIELKDGRLPQPVREYYDVDGNGRIDLARGRLR